MIREFLLKYKTGFIVVNMVLALVTLQGCLGLLVKPKEEEKAKVVPLKFTADSGFVSKSEILPFLIANGLTDTLNDWWKHWKLADTMGKYYSMDSGGRYLLCVLSADNDQTVATNKLIEIDKTGKMTATQDFSCDWCGINARTQALNRRGNYFITYSCGHGSTFSSSWFTLFKSIADRERQAQIMESQYEGAPYCQSIYSAWKLVNDSTCVVNYTVENSRVTQNGCEPADVLKTSVVYRIKDGIWGAADSSKIKQMRIAQ